MRVKTFVNNATLASYILLGAFSLTSIADSMEMTPYQQRRAKLNEQMDALDKEMQNIEKRPGPTTKSVKAALNLATTAQDTFMQTTVPIAVGNIKAIQRCQKIMFDFEATLKYIALVTDAVNREGKMTDDAIEALENAMERFDTIVQNASKETLENLKKIQGQIGRILQAKNATEDQLNDITKAVSDAAFCDLK
jgi:predicted  nucleic acid-binding Zn-ribbon protein